MEGGKSSTTEDNLALNIKDDETHRLARELAELTGTSPTGAVKAALCAAIEREGRTRIRATDALVEDLDAIALHCQCSTPVPWMQSSGTMIGEPRHSGHRHVGSRRNLDK